MKKDIINLLMSNSGKLPVGRTWLDIGLEFGIKAPNKKRAKKDKAYEKKAIATKAQDVWRNYVKRKNKMVLQKEVYIDGKLKSETFKHEEDQPKINYEDFEIERFTTNPNGKAWLKGKRKERIFDEEHFNSLRKLLSKDIKPVSLKSVKTDNSKALFIHGSDKHIGALTKEDSIYTNKYDKAVMKTRIVDNTILEIEENVELFGQFESLYIMEYGDALDGFNKKTTGGLRGTSSHTLPQQMDNREQFDFYLEIHKELFDTIAQKGYAKNVYFVATSNSNHGGDFEYTAMRSLQEYLNLKYPAIKTVVNYKPYNHFFYGKHCIIFGHGKDDEDMRNGLPLVINDKVSNLLADYIRVNKLEDYFVSVITGDLHQAAETYAKNFRYKKVLSQYGSSKWMHTNFGSGSPGLCSEVFFKNRAKILKVDSFFKVENESNTGISFS